MSSVLKRASMGVRWGFLGLASGFLSCAMASSSIIYLAREQKTLDHIVWPGMVFGVVVLLPMSRWAGDGWLRTAAALIASSAVYPIAWRIAAVSVIRHSAPVMIASFASAGFLGSCVLATVFLFGRPRWGGGYHDGNPGHGSGRAYGRASACCAGLWFRWRCTGPIYGPVANDDRRLARSRTEGTVQPGGEGEGRCDQPEGRRAMELSWKWNPGSDLHSFFRFLAAGNPAMPCITTTRRPTAYCRLS